MSINSLYYTSIIAKIASFFSLGVFVYSYWAGLDNRLLILCLGISLGAWLIGKAFEAYFTQVVTKIAIAKHIAEQNMLNEIIEEEAREAVRESKKEAKHPLFEEKDR